MSAQLQPFDQFLYMDPDTGMVVCMVADGDGFRPATAFQEHASISPQLLEQLSADADEHARILVREAPEIDEFVRGYEHAYGASPPFMA